jgi:hypothetical protein
VNPADSEDLDPDPRAAPRTRKLANRELPAVGSASSSSSILMMAQIINGS